LSKKKVRIELRKNRTKPPRENDITKQFQEGTSDDTHSGERIRAKGDLSRHRTIMESETDGVPESDADCVPGRVLRVQGLFSYVEISSGLLVRCTIRRLLKSMSTDERSVVTTGDLVEIRAVHPDGFVSEDSEGVIERIQPRHGVLTRASRRKEHVLVSNVDQLVIVMSLAQPDLKPHLIDRYLATAYKGELSPILCLNKVDLVDVVELQPLIGAYSQQGIPTIVTSAATGYGIERLKLHLKDRATVFSGQSGVGKSSLLNAIQPKLGLIVRTVSEESQKGRHTTTTAQLIRLDSGGWVVDTPGVRQLQLWDTRPEEVELYFPEFHPYVSQCEFPDCTHTHEQKCSVLAAVARNLLSPRRYQSYIGMFHSLFE
jgi:ribosome biogenesis GTPase